MAARELQAAPGRPVDHSHAEESAEVWMRQIQSSRYHRARIRSEARFPSPWAERLRAERDYDDETEQLRRFIHTNPFTIGVSA
jgi:hypothetical protein